MVCAAPSEVTVSPTAKAFGLIAETFIGQEYLKFFGSTKFWPASDKDFQDISLLFGNQQLHTGFLIKNNPDVFRPKADGTLDDNSQAAISVRRLKVPDLLTHDPPINKTPTRAEFYEIKPNSISGRYAGRRKIKSLETDYGKMKLPYVRGAVWKVDKQVKVFKGNLFGFDVKGFFHYKQLQDGLIVYQICVEGLLLPLLMLAMIAAIIAAIVVIIIKRGGIPDLPAPQPPKELPPPLPVPPIPRPSPAPVPIPREMERFGAVQKLGATPAQSASLGTARVQAAAILEALDDFVPRSSPLHGSVGRGGMNRRDDVTIVQALLNDWFAAIARPTLKIDGLSGPRTVAAIQLFQSVFTAVVDGRADPMGPTIHALQCFHLGNVMKQVDKNSLGYARGSEIGKYSHKDIVMDYFNILKKGAVAGMVERTT